MTCSECRDLYQTFQRLSSQYVEARSSAFFHFSPERATQKQISLLRALSDLREHQETCPWAMIADYLAKGST